MPWGAIIGAGANLLGGIMGADAASSAANAQSDATKQANDLQKYIFDTNRSDNAQYRQTGNLANQRLAYLLGLSPSNGSSPSQMLTRDQLRSQLLPQYKNSSGTSWTVLRPATGGQTGIYQNNATGERIESSQLPPGVDPYQAYSGNNVTQEMEGGNSVLRYGAVLNGNSSSIDEAGLNAAIDQRLAQQNQQQNTANTSAQNDPAYGSLLKTFSTQDFYNDPVTQISKQFLQDEGQKAINRQQAATGNALSGATLQALQKFNSGLISQQASDSFNRFNTNQNNIFNKLSGVSGTGQVANSQTQASAQNYGNQAGNNLTSLGNARGASAIAQSNALTGGINGAVNAFQRFNSLNDSGSWYPDSSGYGVSRNLSGYNAFNNGGWGIE